MKRLLFFTLLTGLSLHASFSKAEETAPAADDTTKIRSPAMVITGSALTVLGASAVATGSYFLAHTGQCAEARASAVVAPTCGFYDGMNRVYGYSALAGGAALLLTGIPLIVVGAWRVPFHDEKAQMGLRVGAGDIRFTATF